MDLLQWLTITACISVETTEQSLYRMAARTGAAARYLTPAILLHVLGLCLWLVLLRTVPLGIALPLTGANFVTITLVGRCLFGERTSVRRWAGIALVLIGFVLVATHQS